MIREIAESGRDGHVDGQHLTASAARDIVYVLHMVSEDKREHLALWPIAKLAVWAVSLMKSSK